MSPRQSRSRTRAPLLCPSVRSLRLVPISALLPTPISHRQTTAATLWPRNPSVRLRSPQLLSILVSPARLPSTMMPLQAPSQFPYSKQVHLPLVPEVSPSENGVLVRPPFLKISLLSVLPLAHKFILPALPVRTHRTSQSLDYLAPIRTPAKFP